MVAIEKPLVDEREYRVVVLGNGLEALLVHDAETDKAAAALDVGVGAYWDPEELPGLAHFLEHLLFMGTAKYPSENEYAQYLTDHAGAFNAYTAGERTNFYFEVGHAHLPGALDRFAQFFIAPLFSASCTQRELNAVDSEHKKNLQNDVWRISQVEKALSNQAHPVHKFSTGNAETLGVRPLARGVDVRAQIIAFYQQHYTASVMKLVVVGRESLDELERLVQRFAQVPDPHGPRAAQPPPFDALDPLTPAELGKLVEVQTVMDMKLLEVQFPVPEQQPLHDTQPFHYYVQLLGHESKGSLLYYLKERRLATELACATTRISARTDYLLVTVELTDAGLDAWHDVLAALFAYIAMVRAHPVQPWIFDEIAAARRAKFLYREKGKAMQLASVLAQTLQRPIPRERVLSYSVPTRFDGAAIAQFGEYLVPSNARVLLAAQSVEGDHTEPWYGTRYTVSDLPPLPPCVHAGALHLPHPNAFITSDFALLPRTPASKQTRPRVVLDEPALRVWHKLDDTFGVPKAHLSVRLAHPVCASARTNVLAELFVGLIYDELADYSYYAELAEVRYALTARATALEIKTFGFNAKLRTLLAVVAEAVAAAPLREERFAVVHEQQLRSLRNFLYSEPFMQGPSHALTVLADKCYPVAAKLAELERVNVDDVRAFAAALRAGARLEVLGFGNLHSADVVAAARHVQTLLPAPGEAVLRPASYKFGPGSWHESFTLEDKNNVNAYVEVLFDFGDAHDLRAAALLAVLVQALRERAFDQLRTKEQLGYVVGAGRRQVRASLYLLLFVQSEELPAYLDSRAEHFVQSIAAPLLENMTDEEFAVQVAAVVAEYTQKFRNIDDEADSYWGAIASGFYDFHRKRDIARLATQLTRAEVVQAFRTRVVSADRTRVALHFKAQKRAAPSPETALAKTVGRLVLERGISVPSDVVEAFMVECRGLTPEQALQLLAARLVEHTPLDQAQAAAFAQEAGARCMQLVAGAPVEAEVLGRPLADAPRSLAPPPSPIEDPRDMRELEGAPSRKPASLSTLVPWLIALAAALYI